jgi:hypothetical protein
VTKITSSYTRFLKVVFPAFWFGFLALVLTIAITQGAIREAPMFLLMPFVMAGFGYFFFKHMLWDLVDEVYDCGDSLLVRNRGLEEKIPLSNVMNVNVSTFMNPPRVTLKLATPSIFGSDLTFSPAQRFSFNPFAKNESMEQLIVRVDQARSRRAI